jgi:hypothetical protein
MAQASLNPGVGTFVKDTQAPSWTIDVSSPGNGSWTEVTFPWICQAEAVTGTLGGTGVELRVTIEQADDSSGTNAVAVAAFNQLTEADDAETHVIPVEIVKRYARVVSANDGGAATGTVTVKLRDLDYHRSASRSA